MIRNIFAVAALLLMSIASATFLEQSLTTAGTEQSFSTLVTVSQLGNNTYATFNSTNASDTQNITIKYMSSDYNQHTLTYALTGTTAATTSGLGYSYLVKGTTTAVEQVNSTVTSTNATSYYSLTTTHQPLKTAVHNLTIAETGNGQDALHVYLNGVNFANISGGGSATTTYTLKNMLKTNNVTILRPTNYNFTEVNSNTTAKTGGSGTQAITIVNTSLAGTANVTIYGDIPTLSGTDVLSNVTAKTGGSGTQAIVVSHIPTAATASVKIYADIPDQSGVQDVTNSTALVGATGTHVITLTKTGLAGGNLTVVGEKNDSCDISVTLNDVWQGNITGVNTGATWTIGAGETIVGDNNITYATDCADANITSTQIQVPWEETFNITLNGVLLGSASSSPFTWTGRTVPAGINNVSYASSDITGNLTNSTITVNWTETFNVSLNGVNLGAFATSPSTWTGKTVIKGINNITYASSDTSGNLTNSTIRVLYNNPPNITMVKIEDVYFTNTTALTFTMDDDTANWTLTSAGNGNNSTPCANYSRVVRIVGTSLAYTTDATATSRSVLTNSDSGGVASLNDVAIQNIYIDNNTYLTELWYKDGSGNRIIAAPFRLEYCRNATLTSNVSTSDITTTQYTRTGSITAAINDIAYIFWAKLSSVATGNVTIKDVAGNTIYTILTGATQPVDNGGSNMCISATGCTVKNLFYGGDALFKMTARVFAHDGTNRTAFSVFQAAGTGNYGDGIVTYGAGERVVFYGLPYTSGTNVTLNYEAR